MFFVIINSKHVIPNNFHHQRLLIFFVNTSQDFLSLTSIGKWTKFAFVTPRILVLIIKFSNQANTFTSKSIFSINAVTCHHQHRLPQCQRSQQLNPNSLQNQQHSCLANGSQGLSLKQRPQLKNFSFSPSLYYGFFSSLRFEPLWHLHLLH